MIVVKRDGKHQEFDSQKIFKAIKKSNMRSSEKISDEQISKAVETTLSLLDMNKEELDVENIHKAVENALMKLNFYDVARQYITYRQARDKKRFKKLPLVGVMESKLFVDKDSAVHQNANLDEFSFGGRKGEMDSAFLKEHALNYYISPKFAKNHINNRIYIHDLDSYVLGMHNCLSVPMDELLSSMVHTRQTLIRPAGSVSSALQLIAVYFQLQSLQQFGGVSATHLDWTMVPYVRKSFMKHFKEGLKYIEGKSDKKIESIIADILKNPRGLELNAKIWKIVDISIEDKAYKKYKKAWKYALDMTIKETNQAAEGMLHNLNSLQSRSGNQLPFSSINYGTCNLEEGQIVTRAILNSTIRGTGNGQTSIFPCQIFQLMDGINTKEGDPNYDLFQLAIKSTSRRMYPNYVNCDWSNDQDYADEEFKTSFLNTLTEEQKNTLIEKIQKDPKLGDYLGLYVEDVESEEEK